MFQIIRRLRRGTRGQGLVEFALILPMLIFVMFAFWELSRAFNMYQTITRAAREAARTYVVANGIDSQAEIEAVADNILLSSALDPDQAQITHWPAGMVTDPGEQYSIQIAYPFDFALLRAIQAIQGDVAWDPIMLTRLVTMRKE